MAPWMKQTGGWEQAKAEQSRANQEGEQCQAKEQPHRSPGFKQYISSVSGWVTRHAHARQSGDDVHLKH